MKFLGRIIFLFLSNIVALAAAAYFVPNFHISLNLFEFLKVAVIFTLISVFIKPILTLILSPIILITLGFGLILVNAFVLYLLDFFSNNINIAGLIPLFYATIIISLTNIAIHFLFRRFVKD